MQIDGKAISRDGLLCRVARLRDEYYEFVERPTEFLAKLRAAGVADLFTFIQEVADREPKFSYHREWDSAAVVPLTTYEHWWKKQVNDKTRNMVRKCARCGVDIRLVEFGPELIRGIQSIYNESPVRQGRPFRHYGKDLDTIHREHATFLDRSQFLGAYHAGQLIGFVKLVHGRGISNLMNIISMISHRDKAPTNGLLARAVEICAGKGVPYLQYGTGNSRTIGDFKKHHAFQELRVPRYFVPVSWRGSIALRLGLHRRLEDRIPEVWRDRLLDIRSRWLTSRKGGAPGSGVRPQPAASRVEA